MDTNQSTQNKSNPSAPTQKTCVWAIFALIFAFLIPPLGIILGIVSLVKIKNDQSLTGKGLAIAGIIIGSLITIFIILQLIAVTLLFTGLSSGGIATSCIVGAPFSCVDVTMFSDKVTIELFASLVHEASIEDITVNGQPCIITGEIKGGTNTIVCTGISLDKDEPVNGQMTLTYQATPTGPLHELKGTFRGQVSV
ncbi:hypothetical protein CL622_08510 [archaeon]|nr:hypothetical protein [archaeon]|tara:strand:- start:458 stop:1045 length:588 start_codon:yes stop_codon:yes gene_type:complete